MEATCPGYYNILLLTYASDVCLLLLQFQVKLIHQTLNAALLERDSHDTLATSLIHAENCNSANFINQVMLRPINIYNIVPRCDCHCREEGGREELND